MRVVSWSRRPRNAYYLMRSVDMKKLLLIPLIFSFSCSGEDSGMNAPANLIPSDKMIPLIVDLQILESHFQRTFNRPDLYKDALDSSSLLIFEKHKVSRSQFDSSYSFYASDAHVIYKIYEAALDSLNFAIIENQ
jgi:hypothetical protein